MTHLGNSNSAKSVFPQSVCSAHESVHVDVKWQEVESTMKTTLCAEDVEDVGSSSEEKESVMEDTLYCRVPVRKLHLTL